MEQVMKTYRLTQCNYCDAIHDSETIEICPCTFGHNISQSLERLELVPIEQITQMQQEINSLQNRLATPRYRPHD